MAKKAQKPSVPKGRPCFYCQADVPDPVHPDEAGIGSIEDKGYEHDFLGLGVHIFTVCAACCRLGRARVW